MAAARLSALQWRVLEVLSGLEPRFALTGGSALIGFYLSHRTTRDLDLIWRRRHLLETITDEARAGLRAAGLEVADVQAAGTFHRFRVSDGKDVTLLDLVAEPMDPIQAPREVSLGDTSVLVDTPHEILVNKLVALLGRSELRDLQDIKALVESGEDLDRAVADAPRKDGGFSPLTLAWLLRSFPEEALGQALGWGAEEIAELQRFKHLLIGRLLAESSDEGRPPEVPPE